MTKLLILAICAVLAYLTAVAWAFRVCADEPDDEPGGGWQW